MIDSSKAWKEAYVTFYARSMSFIFRQRRPRLKFYRTKKSTSEKFPSYVTTIGDFLRQLLEQDEEEIALVPNDFLFATSFKISY